MKLFGKAHIVLSVITFVILFLMAYVGSKETDKLSRAFFNGIAGVIGMTVGMFILYKNRNDKFPPENFD